ncbi:MAG: hypothetical protein LBR44_01225, partial [Clostridiales Family XIII bacterium]|nr:hypothetical protein [Clostridiales Family XIII bacterium]
MKKNLMKAAAVALTLAMAAGTLGLSGCAKVAAPSGVGSIELKAGASEGGGAAVTAQWAAADGAAGYEVRCYIAGEGGSEGAPAAEAAPGEDVSGTQCRFDGLAYGQQYTVEVEPYAEGRSGAHVGGEPMAATVSTGAAPVTGLALEANADEAEGEAYVKATWPASEGADGYLVKIEEAGPAAADAAEATADAADTADADAADADAPDAAAETASDKAITDQTAAGTAEAAGTADAPAGTPAADAPAQPGDDADAGADAITDEGATAVTGTEHTFTGLAYGQAYTVTVAAYADGEDGRTVSAATAAEAATGVPALCAPSLTATGASTSEIQLAWDPVEGATGYTLRCGASADAIGDILYEAGADETGYVNGPLGEGATVYYTIAPRFGGHEYAQSEAASATTKVTPKPA